VRPLAASTVASAVLAAVIGVLATAPGGAQQLAPQSPSLSAPAAARPGDLIVVTLTHWPTGVATVETCSNAAARGTQDCALEGDDSIAIRDTKAVAVDLQVATPPGPCPCVIRATTPAGNIVVTTPIVIVGQPTGPIIQPSTPPAGSELHVHARVTTVDEKFPQSVIAPLGGSVHKVLEVDLTNGSKTPADLHVVAEVGKHGDKESIAARNVRGLQPGEHRRLRLPFVISAPAWGTYTVTGSVYGTSTPLGFRATTSNDPWLLELMVPVLLIVVAETVRARERRERRRHEAAVAASMAAAGAGWDPPVTATESSPEVGDSYAERYQGSPYDPSRNGGHVGVTGAGNGAVPVSAALGGPTS